MNLIRKYLFTLFAFAVGFLPSLAFAQLQKIPCPEGLRCPGEGTGGVGITAINGLITLVINYLLGITFGLAVLFIVIGGLRYIVSGGNEESAEKGKKTILNAVIGIIIVILSYIIINLVVNTVTTTPINP
jgi:hypothetical protein